VIIPLQAQDLDLTPDQMGYVVSAGFFVDSAVFPLAGVLMDQYGRKYAGIPSTIIMGCGFAALGALSGGGLLPLLIFWSEPHTYMYMYLHVLTSCRWWSFASLDRDHGHRRWERSFFWSEPHTWG